MTNRRTSKSPKTGRGRPRKKIVFEINGMNNSNDAVITLSSDSADESTLNVSKELNPIVIMTDIAKSPEGLNDQHRKMIAKYTERHKHKKGEHCLPCKWKSPKKKKKVKEGRVKKSHRSSNKNTNIVTEISLLSTSTSSSGLVILSPSKGFNEAPTTTNPNCGEANHESGNAKAVESVGTDSKDLPSFGEPPEHHPWEFEMPMYSNEKSVSNYTASVESNASSAQKRRRSKSEHSSLDKSNESRKKQKVRKSAKRRTRLSEARIEQIYKELEGNISVNKSVEETVSLEDSLHTPKINEVQSYDQQNDSMAAVEFSVKGNIVNGEENIVSVEENIVSVEENIAAPLSIIEKPPIANDQEHYDNFSSHANEELPTEVIHINEDFPPFLSDKEANEMIGLVTNGCVRSTLFPAPDIGNLPDMPDTLISIVQAIDNDVASGSPLLTFGNALDPAEVMKMYNHLPSDYEENQPADTSQETSVRNHTILDGPSANEELENGNLNFENISKQEQTTVIEDETLPKNTTKPSLSLQQIRENRKRRKSILPPIVPEFSVNNNNPTDAIDLEITSEKKSDYLDLDVLIDRSYEFTRHPSAKDDQLDEDALNNNETILVKNKNDVNSGQESITIHRCSPIEETEIIPNADEERNKMSLLLKDMGSNDEVLSEPGSPESNETDKAMAAFEISVTNSQILRNLNDAETEKALRVSKLTQKNLIEFDNPGGHPAEENRPSGSLIPRQTIESDASSCRTDRTKSTTESARIRTRDWIIAMTEEATSLSQSGDNIEFKRTKWASCCQESEEQLLFAKSVEQETEAKEANHLSDESQSTPIKIDCEKETKKSSLVDEFIEVIKKFPPAGLSPGYPTETTKVLPSFDSSNDGNMTTSTPTKNKDESSSSSSDSSSSSSDEDSDDEAEDEKLPGKINVDEVEDEGLPGQIDIDEIEDKELPGQINIDEEFNAVSTEQVAGSNLTDSGIKSATQTNQIEIERPVEVEKPVIPFGEEIEAVKVEKATGSLSMKDGDESENSDDNSDAISLDPGSILSRCGSPEIEEPPEFTEPPIPVEKPPKRSDVRSRLGPRVVPQPSTSTSIVATPESVPTEHVQQKPPKRLITLNKNANVEAAPNEAQAALVAPNGIRIRSIETLPGTVECANPELFFKGQCFAWLKNGSCRRASTCHFKHELQKNIMHHVNNNTPQLNILVNYAMRNQYGHFIFIIQGILMSRMTIRQLTPFIIHLAKFRILENKHLGMAVDELKTHGLTHKEIIESFEPEIPNDDVDTAKMIIELFYKHLQLGTCWETLKRILTKFSRGNLPVGVILAVLNECVTIHKNAAHIEEVYKNLISNLPDDTISALERVAIGSDLLKAFYELRISANAVESNDPPVEVPRRSNWDGSIASPDSSRASIDIPLSAELDGRRMTSSPTLVVQGPSVQDTSRPPTSAGSQERSSTTSSSGSYSVKSIDKLPKAKSVYQDSIWKFHWHLQGLQDALKHREYELVIKILTDIQNDPNPLPHIAGFYNILCKEIMSSRYHLEEIVRRTVQSGVSTELRRFVYHLGTYVITTLADKGYWVLAYDLLKTFQIYGEYNTCAFTLLSAEIYIANHRPLKALDVLKQSRLVFTDPRMWNQLWCAHDEHLRVSVIELLLTALGDRYVEYAFILLEFLLNDQCSSITPININRHVDRIAVVLLAKKKTSIIVDFGRLIIPNNLLIRPKVFRALINHIFQHDDVLAKELHQYGTWLGVYNMPKMSSGVPRLVIKDDWTEEEMFLMFSSLLRELNINIGHAIGKLKEKPYKFYVYLVHETIPTEEQLYMDVTALPLSNAEIKKRRDMVNKVFEQFDPKIKLMQKFEGRMCRIQPKSLLNYLDISPVELGRFEGSFQLLH